MQYTIIFALWLFFKYIVTLHNLRISGINISKKSITHRYRDIAHRWGTDRLGLKG